MRRHLVAHAVDPILRPELALGKWRRNARLRVLALGEAALPFAILDSAVEMPACRSGPSFPSAVAVGGEHHTRYRDGTNRAADNDHHLHDHTAGQQMKPFAPAHTFLP